MKLARALLWMIVPLAVPVASAQSPTVAGETMLQALITEERLDEISGMAASRRHAGLFWVHNDGDNAPELHAIDAQGQLRATLRISGVRNTDWEDLAAFEHEGKHYLVIADVGDNGGLRRELALRIVEEPAQLTNAKVAPAWSVRFRWPDGPRDCESLAVDSTTGTAYLVSKKRVPPELFRVDLLGKKTQIATRIATLAGIDQPSAQDLQRNPVYGRYRSQVTAADISEDGKQFAVLNYRRVYLWNRGETEWGDAVSRHPRVLEFPWVPQAEALAFDPEGVNLWITSERLPAPLLRLPIPSSQQ